MIMAWLCYSKSLDVVNLMDILKVIILCVHYIAVYNCMPSNCAFSHRMDISVRGDWGTLIRGIS